MKVLLLTLFLTACSATPVGLVKDLLIDDPGIEVNTELVVGDKEQELQVGDNQTADSIVNNYESPPFELIALACLGWLLPTPAGMVRGVRNMRSKS
jgi:hypothetical protein